MVLKPDALNPLICEVVRPLVLPMLPLQKIIAVVADARCGPAIIWSTTSAPLTHPANERADSTRM